MTADRTLAASPAGSPPRLTRRGFLVSAGAAGAGLVIGMAVPASGVRGQEPAASARFDPFVRIGTDDTVTVIVKHLEMGQGVATGLAMLVAEELGASWAQMRTEFAPVDVSLYANPMLHGMQATAESTSMANAFMQYREAGALARAALAAAAAQTWSVPASEISVKDGLLSHPGQTAASFGAFADRAGSVTVPDAVTVKPDTEFSLIGARHARLDTLAKINGNALFASDIMEDDMLVAVVARPPRFGAAVAAFDDGQARKVEGVEDVVQIPGGIAVLARSTWPALKARSKLSITWDESGAETRSTRDLWADYHDRAATPGKPVRTEGSVSTALKGAPTALEAYFRFPYLAHAPMEPLSSVIRFTGDRAEVWAASQTPSLDRANVANALQLAPEQVSIETLDAGGSFGRRGCFDSHYLTEAAHIARAHGQGRRIKTVWTRGDDIAGGYYRPMALHHVRAALDKNGMPTAWYHRIVSQSIFTGTGLEAAVAGDGIDRSPAGGVEHIPYAIPNLQVELHTVDTGVPVMRWRSMAHSHAAYVVETFIDELAATAGKDPVEYRLGLLEAAPRLKAVLSLAAEKAGWGTPLADGRYRGVAAHSSFGTSVAQIAEIALDRTGRLKVERVVCALDCGLAINPDQVRAQMESAVGFGLGAALRNAITLDEGRVAETDFDSYQPLRMSDMPEVEVHIVASAEPPTGAGICGVPPIAPAVANAISSATGRRIRMLPFLPTKR